MALSKNFLYLLLVLKLMKRCSETTYYCVFFNTGSHSVTQAGVQWCHHGSLQPQPPWPQVILLPQPPEQLRLQECATTPGLFLYFFCRDGDSPCCPGLEPLNSRDLPALVSQSAEITGVSHCVQLRTLLMRMLYDCLIEILYMLCLTYCWEPDSFYSIRSSIVLKNNFQPLKLFDACICKYNLLLYFK